MTTLRTLTVCLLGSVGTPVLADPLANVICETTPVMEARLSESMHSEKIGQGLRDPETLIEVWKSERGNWALVMTRTNGTSCIVAMGEDWAELSTRPESS